MQENCQGLPHMPSYHILLWPWSKNLSKKNPQGEPYRFTLGGNHGSEPQGRRGSIL